MKLTILIILAYSNLIFADVVGNLVKLENPNPTRVLFIGNSYLYYNDSLHNHVRRMVEETFPDKIDELEFKSATIGGSKLAHHNIDYLLDNENIEVSKPFELVILQGGSTEPLSKESRDAFSNIAKSFVKKIKHIGADAALYMIHAYVEPHEDFDPDMISKVTKSYSETGLLTNSLVLPVGIAFKNAYAEQPNIQLHKDFDGTHPDLLGTYLSACVLFASIYKISPKEIKYNYFDRIGDKDRLFLQQIAHDTVESYFKLKL